MADIVEQESMDQIEDTQKGKFLTFCMGNEFYGIEIKYVTEIIAHAKGEKLAFLSIFDQVHSILFDNICHFISPFP